MKQGNAIENFWAVGTKFRKDTIQDCPEEIKSEVTKYLYYQEKRKTTVKI